MCGSSGSIGSGPSSRIASAAYGSARNVSVGAEPPRIGDALRDLSRTLRLRNRLFAALAVMLMAIGAANIYSVVKGPTETTRDLLCVSVALQGGVHGPNGARISQELRNAHIPLTYCRGFQFH